MSTTAEMEEVAGQEAEVDNDRLLDLIERAKPVMGNPFALYVAECSPSPKAADQYVTAQGWSNDAARAVRALTTLRKKHGPKKEINIKSGESMYETMIREVQNSVNAAVIFENGQIRKLPYLTAQKYFVLANDHLDCRLPLLLREMEDEDAEERITTLDQGLFLSWPVTKEPGFFSIAGTNVFNIGDGTIWNHQEDPDIWHFHIGCNVFKETIGKDGKSNYSIHFGHKIYKIDGKMPAIYKKVTIFHTLASDPRVREVLSAVVRIDYGSYDTRSNYGAMVYMRTITSRYGEVYNWHSVEGSLCVPYIIGLSHKDACWEAYPRCWLAPQDFLEDYPHAFPDGQCMPVIQMYRPTDSNFVGNPMDPETIDRKLGRVRSKIFKNQEPVDLERLLGETFIQSPPKELANLLF